jgi:AcrR family transcriptional regulator
MSESRTDPAMGAREGAPSADEAAPQLIGRRPGQLPSGRHGLTPEYVERNQRERLLWGVARAVSEKGYTQTAVADILRESGVSRKTFYDHFTDKEDCFLAAFDIAATVTKKRVTDVYSEAGAWPERVRRALAAFLESLSLQPEFTRMCVVESLSVGPAALQRYRDVIDVFRELLMEGEGAAPGGHIPPRGIAQAAISGIAAILYREVIENGTKELPSQLPLLTYVALVPYLGRGEASRLAEQAPPKLPPWDITPS